MAGFFHFAPLFNDRLVHRCRSGLLEEVSASGSITLACADQQCGIDAAMAGSLEIDMIIKSLIAGFICLISSGAWASNSCRPAEGAFATDVAKKMNAARVEVCEEGRSKVLRATTALQRENGVCVLRIFVYIDLEKAVAEKPFRSTQYMHAALPKCVENEMSGYVEVGHGIGVLEFVDVWREATSSERIGDVRKTFPMGENETTNVLVVHRSSDGFFGKSYFLIYSGTTLRGGPIIARLEKVLGRYWRMKLSLDTVY